MAFAGMHAIRSVVGIAACAAMLASCASASYQADALQASERGDQKAAVASARRRSSDFSGARPMLARDQAQLRDACPRAGRVPDTRPRQRCRGARSLQPRQRGVEPDGRRDKVKCHRHCLSRRLRRVLEGRRSGARHGRVQGRPRRGCRPVAVHVLGRPGCRSAADRSAIDRLTSGGKARCRKGAVSSKPRRENDVRRVSGIGGTDVGPTLRLCKIEVEGWTRVRTAFDGDIRLPVGARRHHRQRSGFSPAPDQPSSPYAGTSSR